MTNAVTVGINKDSAKLAYVIGGVVLLLIIGAVLWLNWDNWFGKSNTAANTSDLQKLQQSGTTPSYTDSEYQDFADSLFAAMDGVGTDTDAITSIMGNMKNAADCLKLNLAFGTRSGTGTLATSNKETLSQWFVDDGVLPAVNQQLKNGNINYQF